MKLPAPHSLMILIGLISTLPLHGWRPSGWTWMQAPFAYDHTDANWYQFGPESGPWLYGFAPTETWHVMEHASLSNGWLWWGDWPQVYGVNPGAWFHFAEQQEASVVNLQTAELTRFGEVTDPQPEPLGFTKLADPEVLPPGSALAVDFSHDSTYLAVGTTHNRPDHPFLTLYKRVGDEFIKLPDPAELPPGIVGRVAFNHDSTYLAVTHSTSPNFSVYRRSGDTFTKLADPDILPPHSGLDAAFSSDATYLAIGHNNKPYVAVYRRSGDTLSRVNTVIGEPAGNGYSVAFSPDDTYLAVGNWAWDGTHFGLYLRDGDTFTRQPDLTEMPPGDVYSIAFSPDGIHMVLGHGSNVAGEPRGISIYKREGNAFTRLPYPPEQPAGPGRDLAFSRDGSLLAVSHTSGARVTVYHRSGDTFTKLPDPDVLPTGANGYSVAFSHDNRLMIVAHNSYPYISIYRIGGFGKP
jgi:WD40 repeat protein